MIVELPEDVETRKMKMDISVPRIGFLIPER